MLRGLVITIALTVALAGDARAQGVGCSWYVQSNPDAVNVAYPDESAIYWGTTLPQAPTTGLVLRGRVPDARYFSIHAYDPLLRPVGALADYEIDTEADSSYELRIVGGTAPETPAPNTIYAGRMFEGGQNPGGFVLYRIYVPRDPKDPTGGVGLPAVSFFAADGAAETGFGECDVTGALPDTGVNDATRENDYTGPNTPPTRVETPKPGWLKFFGYGSLLGTVPDNPITPAVTPGGGGFLSNVHNDYVTAAINRTHGDVVVFRARMPTFGRGRRKQLRYWSICQNETFSQRYVACVADYQAKLGRRGRKATFVISDPGDRPSNATRKQRVNWMPWGAYPEGRIIYRQMVAARSFKRSIARIEAGDDARKAMGPYYPRIRYCDKATFERIGARGCLTRPLPTPTR